MAEQKHRIFEIDPTSTATLARLKLLNGEVTGRPAVGSGGAVLSKGSLTVQDSEIHRSKTQGGLNGGFGGGIAATQGTLDLTGVTISGNEAGFGGGIYIGERVFTNITGGLIERNSATYGGGISIASSTNAQFTHVTLNNVHVFGNQAQVDGGGIYAGNATEGSGTWLTLTNNTWIHANSIVLDAFGRGGGIYFGRGLITFSVATIAFNHAGPGLGDGLYRVQGQTTIDQNPVVTYIDDSEVVGP
ncbi:MAG: hypothetical protein L0241_30015 [Planctomycetia bacterium]|nr:hypothetical protein [Planctomycetia bacterium]